MDQRLPASKDDQRIKESKAFRIDAAHVAAARAQQAVDQVRPNSLHVPNEDEAHFLQKHLAPMSFTKGLTHDPETGMVADIETFKAFRAAVNSALIANFEAAGLTLDRDPPIDAAGTRKPRRQWEAPTAGSVFDLEGPDAQAVTMQAAPGLSGGADDAAFKELALEMAEVYELAILRDVPFNSLQSGSADPRVAATVARLVKLNRHGVVRSNQTRPSFGAANGDLTPGTVFRGSSPKTDIGPYLSQFMLIGNGDPADGQIAFGSQTIDQRVKRTRPEDPADASFNPDYMIDIDQWRRVQDGADTRDNATLFDQGTRFIHTPRDLATYVHDDALYQAYLNACLILLGMGAPLDVNFTHLAGGATQDTGDRPSTTGFALFGGPHILSLLTEVATRGLKAVRYQKFNIHLRARPEVLAARVACAPAVDAAIGHGTLFQDFAKTIGEVVQVVRTRNAARGGSDLPLLPMAFQEGSPMHPTYGAGHATVAGACVTMLKAFFDIGETAHDVALYETADGAIRFKRKAPGDSAVQYVTNFDGSALVKEHTDTPLTLEGELNKLAANISIGRNMAGVHYYSDYYDSLRMGEKIAIGILEEQALGYSKDPLVLSLRTFDNESVTIARGGLNNDAAAAGV
ncbi:vanadium-dependent haloperoxidase [Actibacterium sp. 188UL27-1]|uniref:vanadium-dependent haloperoxidase n=1 Tax=Actibacterium sp. 188UL27-1 TaxID=2786961 RepID=UPI00195E4B70|nr:vanadium-dependent haloperoxidase [Actibacterium sp. 188UL27-1]MBM7069346.1 vanadium-dependent haloperoxidase [Actibacterium sp. 188UL27-1]